jgi:hypothetical protein
MWDLSESTDSIALIESFYNSGKPVALVCHSPGVLHRVTYKGAPIVKGKRVTGFANSEEEEVHLTNVVPFLVEDELKRLGGIFEKSPNWQPFSIVDGRLITGQNPASSTRRSPSASEDGRAKSRLGFYSRVHMSDRKTAIVGKGFLVRAAYVNRFTPLSLPR